MSKGQIACMIAMENIVVAVVSVLIGLPIGRVVVEQFWRADSSRARASG